MTREISVPTFPRISKIPSSRCLLYGSLRRFPCSCKTFRVITSLLRILISSSSKNLPQGAGHLLFHKIPPRTVPFQNPPYTFPLSVYGRYAILSSAKRPPPIRKQAAAMQLDSLSFSPAAPAHRPWGGHPQPDSQACRRGTPAGWGCSSRRTERPARAVHPH